MKETALIKLSPMPEVICECPACGQILDVKGWYMPGMRTLADLHCSQCRRQYYGDLPIGHGMFNLSLIEKKSATISSPSDENWYAEWLKNSYASRVDTPVEFDVEQIRIVRKPLILNCLDAMYGHSLLKLLNAQIYLDHHPEFDLIVIVPAFLRWMVPTGVAEIWSVKLPLRQGSVWNDWLAVQFCTRLAGYSEVHISKAWSHPHPLDFDIERFTGVKPFNFAQWAAVKPYQVTFIWREDRFWVDLRALPRSRRLYYRLKQRWGGVDFRSVQLDAFRALADDLRLAVPDVHIVVAGIGTFGTFQSWVEDLRTDKVTQETERTWCHRYARSHVVIGIHGSNLLLPSAHAGMVINLMKSVLSNRNVEEHIWWNALQDIALQEADPRLMAFRCHLIPKEVSTATLAHIIKAKLLGTPSCVRNFIPPNALSSQGSSKQLVGAR